MADHPLASQSMSRAIIESAPLAMVMVDAAGTIVLVNREAEALFGYSREELLGQAIEVLVPNAHREAHPAVRDAFFERPAARRMGAGRDLFALRKDGTEFSVEIGLNPLETPEGTFVLAAVVDITERKKLEARFRATVESAPVAMIMIGPSGGILLANAETEKLFGYEPGELLGRALDSLVPERFRADHPGHRHAFFADPRARRMGAGRDLFALRKDGTEFSVEIGLNPVETPEGVFVLAAIVDITARKELEDALRNANTSLEARVAERTEELARQRDDLRHANEALAGSNLDLQRFAYVASHDLQAPLRSISGFVQLLRSRYAGKLDERADDWIRRTIESAKQMQTLITHLLSYSRIESPSRARRFDPTPLRSVVDDAIAMLEATIAESGATITCEELPTVSGDRPQLVQLLQNLIGNALHYRKEEPPRVHISARANGAEWEVAVRDNGIGIEPRYHERIFEIFKRLHTQSTHPGTGIGLAICRRVVERHGGRIWVEAAEGGGSVFRFTIARQREESESS